jgi:hypothetical protein
MNADDKEYERLVKEALKIRRERGLIGFNQYERSKWFYEKGMEYGRKCILKTASTAKSRSKPCVGLVAYATSAKKKDRKRDC